MKQNKFLLKALILGFMAICIFASCKVGLGASIDTQKPLVSFVTPEPDATKKGTFTISGTASDDSDIRSVNINLVLNGESKYSYNATVNKTEGTWTLTIPTIGENGDILVEDGNYEFQAIATDIDGKTSSDKRAIRIDNTAPTVLVNSPSLFDENKSTFFRQLRVSGSCYDASNLKSVKVYFYAEEDFKENTEISLEDESKIVSFTASGTNTWELNETKLENLGFFKDNKVYNFFVVAEDESGNKNTYFYRMGDFYSENILSDATDDGDDYIPFPSMMEIGNLDQGKTVENPTSNLSKEGLDKIRVFCDDIQSNNSNFIYKSESRPSVSWGNIEYLKIEGEQITTRSIPLETDITGQITTTDGTDIMTDTVEVWLKSVKDENWWQLQDDYITLDSTGNTVAFNLVLKNDGEILKSGNYWIKIKYKTIASQNSPLLESDEHAFGISAGLPILTETKLKNDGTSPISLQIYTNAEEVILGGKALKGDRTPVDLIVIRNDGEEMPSLVPESNGDWILKLTAAGDYRLEISIEDGDSTSIINRTIVIDRTAPSIENLSFYQSADMKTVTLSAFLTDENSLENIEYAFIKSTEEVQDSDWKTPEDKKKNNLNEVLKAEDFGFETFDEGEWTVYIRAKDLAGNIAENSTTDKIDYNNPTVKITSPESDKQNAIFKFDGVIEDTKALREKDPIEIIQKDSEGNTLSVKATVENWKNLEFPLKAENETSPKDDVYTITITATDWCEKTTTVTKTIKFDTKAPEIEVQNLTEGSTFTTRNISVNGTVRDDSSISGVYYAVAQTQPAIPTDVINGTWTGWTKINTQYSLKVELKFDNDGKKTFYLVVVDELGNKSEVKSINFSVDATPPTLKLDSNINLSSTNFTTSSFIVSGLVSDEIGLEKVDIISGNKTLKTIKASEILENKWSYEIPANELTADIATNIVVKAKDNAGNETSSQAFNIYKDTKAPEIVLRNLSNGSIITESDLSENKFTVKGSWNDNGGSGISGGSAKIQYSFDGTTWNDFENKTGTWENQIPLHEENLSKDIYFKSVDAVGNTSDINLYKYNVVIDKGIPTISFEDAYKGADINVLEKGEEMHVISGTAEDSLAIKKVDVSAKKGGNPVTENWKLKTSPNGNKIDWNITIDTTSSDTDGKWIFTIRAEDEAGRESNTETINVMVDTKAPEFSDVKLSPEAKKVGDKNWYPNQNLKISGTVIESNDIDKIEFTTDGQEWSPCSFGSEGDSKYEFSANVPVDGEWDNRTITIKATDIAGKSQEYSYSGINVDKVNPTLTIKTETSGIFVSGSEGNITVDIEVVDNESGVASVVASVEKLDFANPAAEVTGNEITSITIPADKIPEVGDIGTVYLQVKDNCGNISQTSFNFQKDKTAPTVSISSHANEAKVNGTIVLKGTTSETQGLKNVTIKDENGKVLNSIDGNEGFTWECSIDTTDYSDEATHKFTVTATDKASNSRTCEITLKVSQKSDRPVISINNTPKENKYINQSFIFGAIADDDGEISLLKVAEKGDENIDWDSVIKTTCANGSFVFTMTEKDGPKELYFYVKDSSGKEYVSSLEADATNAPVLEYNKAKTTQSMKFELNTKLPEIKDEQIVYIDSEGKEHEEQFVNNIKVGGDKAEFDIKISAKDGNGIKTVYLKADGVKVSDGVNENGTWKISVNTKDVVDGNIDFEIFAVDNAGETSSISRNLLVDNTAPTITVDSHVPNEQVTGIVKLIGTTDDGATGSGVNSVKWAIAKKSELNNGKPNSSVTWNTLEGATSWNVKFEGINELREFANEEYAEEQAGKNIWKLPIFFLIEDKVGNKTVESFVLNIDPDGDRPRTEITYPVEPTFETDGTTNDTLGGTIRIFGTAEDNVAVSSVQMQIDVNNDGYFNSGDSDLLNSSIYTIKGSADDWYIEVDGKTSWNMTINSKGEFNPNGDGTKTIRIRVRAIDNNGLEGVWTDARTIVIDKSAPRIGSNDPLRLVQYEDNVEAKGNEIASVAYTPDMWIKGNWWLVGSVQDESGIKSFNIEKDNASSFHIEDSDMEKTPVEKGKFDALEDSGYRFKIPLITEGKTGSLVAFTLKATDNTEGKPGEADVSISIKFDNTAPQFIDGKPLMHSKTEVSKDVPITQDNNTYEFESAVTESGSGFHRLAIYFKRTKTDGSEPRIYNPVLAKDDEDNRTNITDDDIKYGLPRLTVEADVKRPTEDSIEHSSLANNKNIRKGGLVRIAGVERLITDVDSTNGIVTFSPAVDKSYKTAEFAYALVVDNFKVENATAWDVSGNPTIISNDDGDMVVESVEKSGATYDWTLAINSKNIPDGPITICYVAYDEAGNFTEPKEVETSIQNNRPAIAKVWLGTDLNGDGKVAKSEEVEYRSNISKEEATYDVALDTTVNSNTVPLFTAKGNTTIRPDIVGGNGKLYYTAESVNKTILRGTDEDGNTGDGTILLEVKDKKLAGKSDSDVAQEFVYKIWDSTEECTVGVDTQWAQITVNMMVDVVDDVAPTVVIDPLYWKSKTDNSLYEKSTENGHIELSADLPETFKEKEDDGETDVTGVMDRDDKVSGKITFTGTAYDDVRLQGLNIKFDNFDFGDDNGDTGDDNGDTGDDNGETFKVIEFSGKLSNKASEKTIDKDGWEFSFEEEYFDQRGHFVKWTLSIDTAKIEGVAATDVELTVTAKDKGNNSSSTEKVENEDETKENVPSYKVDVVPYITGLETWLVEELKTSIRDAYSRTALGHYIINENEGNITLTGFNLGGNTTIDSSAATTGAYSVSVNGVESLNNKNNNNAKGSYAGSITEKSSYEEKNNYAYNRLANGRTNNLLTDDIIFDVWEFDSDAAIPESGKLSEPVMKINPKTGKVGFAFVSGPAHFSMGAGTGNSYETYQRNYATFSNISFAYDDNGNSYGTATGLDTYPDGATNTRAGRFTFMTSRWGKDTDSMDDNYNKENKIRFEAIGVPGASNCYVKGVYPDSYTMTETRFYSPSMAVTTHGDAATVYLAYYDDIQDQIRFRYGTVGATRTSFGNFEDNNGVDYDQKDANGSLLNNKPKYVFESHTTNFSLIAGADWQNYAGSENTDTGLTKLVKGNYFYDTGYEADAYVAIDAIKGTTAASDIVVAVWYDGKDCYYAYNTDPDSGKDNGKAGGWTTTKIFSGGGEYCTIKVDSNNGIHIAANVDGALKYAYLSSYSASSSYDEASQAIKIDSCAITGEQITIDVGKKTIGRKTYEIPYISYYMSASKKPCIAYITENAISDGTMNYAAAGTDQNDCFTGNWEVSVIPSQSELSGGNSDKINVGLWKDTTGNIVNSYLKNANGETQNVPSEGNTSGTSSGNCYGNGTANPIFGYAVKSTSGTCIETAQLK